MKNYGKASLRFQNILKVHGLPHGRPEPKRRHCTWVLPSPFNRLGRPLNYRYIHFDLAPNLAKDGFNPNRPTPGLIVVRTKPDRLKRLHDHAKEMHRSNQLLLPPLVITENTNRECLGGNHLTVTLRMYNSTYKSPLSGHVCECTNDTDPHLVLVAIEEGHWYFELDDEVTDDDCKFLSELLNSDQNQNQCNSEDHLRRMIQDAIASLTTPERPVVPTSNIIDFVSKQSVVKIRPDTIGDTAHLVSSLGKYNTELCNWYSENVNPREMSISARWQGELAKTLGEARPLCKLGACFLYYRGICKLDQTRPLPDISRTIDTPLMNALVGRDVDKLNATEEAMSSTRRLLEGHFFEKIGRIAGQRLFHIHEELLMRLLCGKSLHIIGITMDHTISGKWTPEKATQMLEVWVSYVMKLHPELGDFGQKFGICALHGDDAAGKHDSEVETAPASPAR